MGLQGQVPGVPYTALWNRLAPFDPLELSRLMESREAVRAPLMRTTLHTVTAADALSLRPLVQPVLERTFSSTSWGQALRGLDVATAMQTARDLVAEQPRTRAELGRLLQQRFPDLAGASLAYAFSYVVPTAQPTPRGLWDRSGAAKLVTLDAWLPEAQVPELDLAGLVRRYLAAFGPATVKDVQAWSGLTRLREVTAGMGLRRWSGPAGEELLDLPDAEVPDEGVPAPPRFLPEYDNGLLGYADRSRVVADVPIHWPQAGPGGALGSLLIDGRVQASWALRTQGSGVRLTIWSAHPVAAAERQGVEAEAGRLVEFLAPGRGADLGWSALP